MRLLICGSPAHMLGMLEHPLQLIRLYRDERKKCYAGWIICVMVVSDDFVQCVKTIFAGRRENVGAAAVERERHE